MAFYLLSWWNGYHNRLRICYWGFESLREHIRIFCLAPFLCIILKTRSYELKVFKRVWFSGRISRCQWEDPSSILGTRIDWKSEDWFRHLSLVKHSKIESGERRLDVVEIKKACENSLSSSGKIVIKITPVQIIIHESISPLSKFPFLLCKSAK